MPIEWTAAELDQNRLMNRARSGRIVPKGQTARKCEGCATIRNPLALYRTDTLRRACRSCLDVAAPAVAAAPVRKARKVAPVVAPVDVPSADGIERSRRDDNGDPSPSGTAAAHEYGEPCDCGECVAPAPVRIAPVGAYLAGESIAAAVDALAPVPPVVAPAATVDAGYAARVAAIQRQNRDDMAAYVAEYDRSHGIAPAAVPAPAAPVVAPVPVDVRPTCPRCGQTFRASGSGLAWHLANRPDCAGTATVAPVAPAIAPTGAYVN